MNPPGPPQYGRPLPPPLPAFPPASSTFWNTANVVDHLKNLHDTMNLATALKKELEMLSSLKDEKEKSEEGSKNGAGKGSTDNFVKLMEHSRINMESQESLSLEAANALISKLRAQLEPFRVITDEMAPWEEKSVAVRLANKMHKYKRNKLWRKRKRKRVAEKLSKEREQFDQIDAEADEWRAREIAKDIAKRKVEKMKEIAKLKEKQEKKRLESELELALMVEKLQELRSIGVQKLKKQGHFLPEEDDKFLEKVRAAVEEEERQAKAAAETDVAKDAIATAEESRKTIPSHRPEPGDLHANTGADKINQDQTTESKDKSGSTPVNEMEKGGPEGLGSASLHDSVANLPLEFYHYYYGSNHDLGTLIEVRRTWDAYIRPGGRFSLTWKEQTVNVRKKVKKEHLFGEPYDGQLSPAVRSQKAVAPRQQSEPPEVAESGESREPSIPPELAHAHPNRPQNPSVVGIDPRATFRLKQRFLKYAILGDDIVIGDSRIPGHWVQPPAPADKIWASYLVKPK